MSTAALWPPLDEVRRALGAPLPGAPPGATAAQPAAPADAPAPASELPQPLRALAATRRALAALQGDGRWSPGDLVALPGPGGTLLGVLLDEKEQRARPGQAATWRGWLAVAEADWAGAYDVLLEPEDEPFDPVAGVVQAWNPVRVTACPAPVLGRLSAARLAAVRAVRDEHAQGTSADVAAIASCPGSIALREAGGFTVLTGTPLGPDDPRADYQALYRDAGARLLQPAPAGATAAPVAPVPGWWARLREWLGAGVPTRIGLAGVTLAALVLILQGLYPAVPIGTPMDDEVRFRSLPGEPAAGGELSVRWRDGADPEAVAALVRSFGGESVGGPNAAGRWTVRTPDPAAAQRALLASPLVLEVTGP